MKYKLKDISIGDQVVVDDTLHAFVDSVEADLKNGMPGITYTTEDKKGGFCYLVQITQLIKKEKEAKIKTVQKVINRPGFKDLAIGDEVVVSNTGDRNRTGIIEEVEKDFNNGMSGISFNSPVDGFCWCYTNQIMQVIKQVPETKVKKKM